MTIDHDISIWVAGVGSEGLSSSNMYCIVKQQISVDFMIVDSVLSYFGNTGKEYRVYLMVA